MIPEDPDTVCPICEKLYLEHSEKCRNKSEMMTHERKEEIREILADETRACSKCGYYVATHSRYWRDEHWPDHDYVRAIRLEDELLAALDFADSALQGR